jgi:ubiquinol-cytochrome c reductase cytochrome c1 subunit
VSRSIVSKWLLVAVAFVCSGSALAQHDAELEQANNNIANMPSLQRGAKYFVNYCMGCHSAKYVRYNRLAEDLQISEDQLVRNLMFTGERPFDTMAIAMPPQDATRWFGIAPPDLSLIARSRGTDYIFTFLRSFYVDPTSPTGADNRVLPGTAMPHVLWELQGIQEAKFVEDEQGGEPHFDGFELVRAGQLEPEAFDQVVRDVVNFLEYIAEPVQRQRQALGIRVIAFLLVFLLIAWMLKREIWKDVK